MPTREQVRLFRIVREAAAGLAAQPSAGLAGETGPVLTGPVLTGRQLFRLWSAYYDQKIEFLRLVDRVQDPDEGVAYLADMERLEEQHRLYRERLVRFCLEMARYLVGLERGRERSVVGRAVQLMQSSDSCLAHLVAAARPSRPTRPTGNRPTRDHQTSPQSSAGAQ